MLVQTVGKQELETYELKSLEDLGAATCKNFVDHKVKSFRSPSEVLWKFFGSPSEVLQSKNFKV